MGDLGLNEHHQNIVLGYLRFSRHERSQKLRSIDLHFDDVKLSRLSMEDSMFTAEEVGEMLSGVAAVVKADVETELLNSSHTTVLLLRQLFSQAEKWHLKLQADISELENQELLDAIKSFEESEQAGTLQTASGGGSDALGKHRLEPMHDSGTTDLLQQEIARVNAENEKLKNQLKMVEGQAQKILTEKSKLSEDLYSAKSELGEMRNKKKVLDGEAGGEDVVNGEVDGAGGAKKLSTPPKTIAGSKSSGSGRKRAVGRGEGGGARKKCPLVVWHSSGSEEDSADIEQRCSQYSDDVQCPMCQLLFRSAALVDTHIGRAHPGLSYMDEEGNTVNVNEKVAKN